MDTRVSNLEDWRNCFVLGKRERRTNCQVRRISFKTLRVSTLLRKHTPAARGSNAAAVRFFFMQDSFSPSRSRLATVNDGASLSTARAKRKTEDWPCIQMDLIIRVYENKRMKNDLPLRERSSVMIIVWRKKENFNFTDATNARSSSHAWALNRVRYLNALASFRSRGPRNQILSAFMLFPLGARAQKAAFVSGKKCNFPVLCAHRRACIHSRLTMSYTSQNRDNNIPARVYTPR